VVQIPEGALQAIVGFDHGPPHSSGCWQCARPVWLHGLQRFGSVKKTVTSKSLLQRQGVVADNRATKVLQHLAAKSDARPALAIAAWFRLGDADLDRQAVQFVEIASKLHPGGEPDLSVPGSSAGSGRATPLELCQLF
jgi:hypothetical protein